MDMNFPHKSLDQASSVPERKERGMHQALLAHAIARQALSPSARAYAARNCADKGNEAVWSRNIMQDRIVFFAGSSGLKGNVSNGYPFEAGHFRPDILSRVKQE